MTQSELLAVAKPILFNSDMVRAILAGETIFMPIAWEAES